MPKQNKRDWPEFQAFAATFRPNDAEIHDLRAQLGQ
jgi:hypothetical protein